MSKVTPTRRSRASAGTRIATPVDYWKPAPGQADFPDEPVPPSPKRPIGSGTIHPDPIEDDNRDRQPGSSDPPPEESEEPE